MGMLVGNGGENVRGERYLNITVLVVWIVIDTFRKTIPSVG
jgi:hypothetical protein